MEEKNDFLRSLEKDLEQDLNNLAIENQKQQEKYKVEMTELVKKELAEIEKKIEQKLKNFYYWLFGIFLVLLAIIIGVFFALQNPK